jgi:hypothetical protein
MFSTLQELKNLFGRSFVLGVFFPVLIVVAVSLGLYFEVFWEGLGAVLASWETLPLQIQLFISIVGLIAITVLASLIYSFQYSITRLFEGYWPRAGVIQWFRDQRVNIYRQNWEYLNAQTEPGSPLTETEKAGILGDLLIYYPPGRNYLDKLMPTRLGNILRASEIYSYDHYGIDSIIIWTRLYPLLSKEAITPLENTQTGIDFMLLMAALAATFTLVWCPVLAFATNRWGLFLICSLGCPFAWICYQNAVQRALVYSEQFKVIFDLHRHDLLKVLNLSAQTEEERTQWADISDFFHFGMPMPYKPASKGKLQGWDQVAGAIAKYIKRMNYPKS